MEFADSGEAARGAAGIDGTPGDAQDVPHVFVAAGQLRACVVCGMGARYRKHIGAVQAQGEDGVWEPAAVLPITPGLEFEVYGPGSEGGIRWEACDGARVVASGRARTRLGARVQMVWCWVRCRVGLLTQTT
ncbi:hypothetical protein [Streptomonospora litoralis]|uniref:Uncharacterized protein n=1 Tax=Streptomonospora litoralis TaxID=2498135 RepID=A0A4P6QBA8_9ACTN|nr:hypothetical protein [Streptomonospora litoralis]QBI56864.1 hypothetical protein EKD16_25620 [Streptomonospora litoralis]